MNEKGYLNHSVPILITDKKLIMLWSEWLLYYRKLIGKIAKELDLEFIEPKRIFKRDTMVVMQKDFF